MNVNHTIQTKQKALKKLMYLLLAAVLISMQGLSAQGTTIKVSGKVISSQDNETLIGVSVREKGTSNGTITNYDGVYSFNVSPTATLVFSYVGFASIEAAVNNRNTINISLNTDTEMLEELASMSRR